MNELHIPQRLRNVIYNRWLEQKLKSFKEFAPYAYYCLKTNILFYCGLICNLITTRRTNRIDLEYLYYLPFCMVFSSGGKFHKDVSPLLLRDDQEFIDRDVLKNDLQWLSSEWSNLSKDERQKRFYDYDSYPPNNPESITYRLWKIKQKKVILSKFRGNILNLLLRKKVLKSLKYTKMINIDGYTLNRPALKELLEDAKQRKFDLVSVHKIDRCSRNLKDLLNLVDELSSYGVGSKSATDSYSLMRTKNQNVK